MGEAEAVYEELFYDTSLEVGKTLSKSERDSKSLTHEKVNLNKVYSCVSVTSFVFNVSLCIYFTC